MKFLIERTSLYDNEQPPCDGVTRETFTRVEYRTLPTPKAFDAEWGKREGLWHSKGVNHRTYHGGICRDHPNDADGWFREFGTLEELIAFVDEHGECLIGWSMWNADVRSIEIVDAYR